MTTLTVISPGFLTTVQDLGRSNCAHWGISPSGAADSVSFRLGNLLVGNQQDAPALEMTLIGGSFRFELPCTIALTGSDFGAVLDGQEVPMWQTLIVNAGQLLQCGQTKSGARTYLCVGGGIMVPRVFSSAATHLLTALGGVNGRALRIGDLLEVGGQNGNEPASLYTMKPDVLERLFRPGSIRITPGPEHDLFVADAMQRLCSSQYRVKEDSNRMGLRLYGPPLERAVPKDLTTEGVSLGAIQVPPDGEPIILFVEQPTTGGYPKIANVASVDLHRVGQLRPRDSVKFTLVTFDEAVRMLAEQEALLTPHECLAPIQR